MIKNKTSKTIYMKNDLFIRTSIKKEIPSSYFSFLLFTFSHYTMFFIKFTILSDINTFYCKRILLDIYNNVRIIKLYTFIRTLLFYHSIL